MDCEGSDVCYIQTEHQRSPPAVVFLHHGGCGHILLRVRNFMTKSIGIPEPALRTTTQSTVDNVRVRMNITVAIVITQRFEGLVIYYSSAVCTTLLNRF